MIDKNTTLRDWINDLAERRNRKLNGIEQIPCKKAELKRRLDDLEQRRQYEALNGKDPY